MINDLLLQMKEATNFLNSVESNVAFTIVKTGRSNDIKGIDILEGAPEHRKKLCARELIKLGALEATQLEEEIHERS